jgi:outer membrane protein TolC
MTKIKVITALMFLSACAVGPDFTKPAAPGVSGYTSSPVSIAKGPAHIAGGGNQALVSGADIPAEWWKVFQSQPLDDLIKRALAANPNLKAAQAALTVAHENTLAQGGAYYPSVSAGFSVARQKTSTAIAPVPNSNSFIFNLYTPQVSVSYTPDVFGLNRRTVEALKAEEDSNEYHAQLQCGGGSY